MQNWKVLFVKPRTEKKVSEYCKLYGIPFYLPLREKTRVYQRRKVVTHLPVFAGYVFACFPDSQQRQLLQTDLLVRVLVPKRPRLMLRDLVMVRRALLANPALTPTQPLQKGRMIRIMSGPFMGIEGRVARMAGTMRVVINVEMIGQAIAINATTDQIETL